MVWSQNCVPSLSIIQYLQFPYSFFKWYIFVKDTRKRMKNKTVQNVSYILFAFFVGGPWFIGSMFLVNCKWKCAYNRTISGAFYRDKNHYVFPLHMHFFFFFFVLHWINGRLNFQMEESLKWMQWGLLMWLWLERCRVVLLWQQTLNTTRPPKIIEPYLVGRPWFSHFYFQTYVLHLHRAKIIMDEHQLFSKLPKNIAITLYQCKK